MVTEVNLLSHNLQRLALMDAKTVTLYHEPGLASHESSLKVHPYYNLDSIRIQSRSTETRFNQHQLRPHYTTVCGLSAQVLGISTNSCQQRLPAKLSQHAGMLVVSTRRLRTAKCFFVGATDRVIHCKPVTAADLDQAGLLVRATLQVIATDADQGRYLTNPKRSLSTPQQPSQTPWVDFHGCAHNESSLMNLPP